jgi:hypothetical protein
MCIAMILCEFCCEHVSGYYSTIWGFVAFIIYAHYPIQNILEKNRILNLIVLNNEYLFRDSSCVSVTVLILYLKDFRSIFVWSFILIWQVIK